MTLETGTRLGPYEIVELLGKGGMGEVYRAHDTKLGQTTTGLQASIPSRIAFRAAETLPSSASPSLRPAFFSTLASLRRILLIVASPSPVSWMRAERL